MSHFFLALASALLAGGVLTATTEGGQTAAEALDTAKLHLRYVRTHERVEKDRSQIRQIEAYIELHDATAVAQFGQLGFPYVAGSGEVSIDEVVIRKANGERVDVTNSPVEDLNTSGMGGMSRAIDLRLKRLTVPGLEAGDHLIYSVTLTSKPVFPDHVYGEATFMPTSLVDEQVYELHYPEELTLAFYLSEDVASSWEEIDTSRDRRVRRVILHGNPSEGQESNEMKLLEPDIIFTSFRSWEELGSWWWGMSHERMRPNAEVRAEATRLVEGLNDPRERIKALYAFVAEKIRFLTVAFGQGHLRPRTAEEVLATRYGDCKDKHTLLAAMAAALDIDVKPALINNYREQLHDEAPAPTQFDHIVSVAVLGPEPSEWLWIDTSFALGPVGYFPVHLRDKQALLVESERSRLVVTPASLPYPTRKVVETHGTLDASGPLKAHVLWRFRDDDEPTMRMAARIMPTDRWEAIGRELASDWSKGKVGGVKLGDPGDLDTPFEVEYDVEHFMTSKVFAKPWDLWLPVPKFELPELPDQIAAEGTAIELPGPDEFLIRFECEIPEGMKARAPLAVNLEHPFASYQSEYAVEGRKLVLERSLHIHRREIASNEVAAYEALRNAVIADRKQEFPIEALSTASSEPTTASELHSAGFAALERDEFAEAERHLRRVTEMEPQHKWAWNNLGRALKAQGKYEEALEALTRQIDINPFDQYAYNNRGDTFMRMGRLEEAEKDFEKQIEVAPLEPFAYRHLAEIRVREERYDEAAELLGRATSASPDHTRTWVRLAWTHARRGDVEGVRDAAERVRSLDADANDWLLLAGVLGETGDWENAESMAKGGIERLVKSLDGTTPETLNKHVAWDTMMLGEGWRALGGAALARGDLSTAEQYLTAAWELTFSPDAGLDLAQLKDKQGRSTEQLDTLAEAASQANRGHRARVVLENEVKGPGKSRSMISDGGARLTKRRSIAVSNRSSVDITTDVLLLVAPDGSIEGVSPVNDELEIPKEVQSKILTLRVPVAWPDDSRHKFVLQAGLYCGLRTGCALVLHTKTTLKASY